MYDRFLIPCFFFWPIVIISFIFIFLIPTNSKLEIINVDYKNLANFYEGSDSKFNLILFGNFSAKEKEIKEEIINSVFPNENYKKLLSDKCYNYLKFNDKDEIKKINLFNKAIKIIVIALFPLICLNIGIYRFCKYLIEYDGEIEDKCEYTFTIMHDEEHDIDYRNYWFIYIFLFFYISFSLTIVILSGYSIDYSSQFKNKILKICNFKFEKDYTIKKWRVSIPFLSIILALYLLEVLFCIYSICYHLIALH